MMMPNAYLEVSPMFEEYWTGIPNVAAAIAHNALRDSTIHWQFTFENALLPNEMVKQFLVQRSGVGGLASLADLVWTKPDISYADGQAGVGIFTGMKSVREFYAREAMIIYDLSPLLTPHFHTSDNINHFSDRIRDDIETTNHFFCISQAAANDVSAYFEIPSGKIDIIPMAFEYSPSDLSIAQGIARRHKVEPYIVVLGTLEPRKNGRLVLEYIARNPSFASQYRFVFVGREGWLSERSELMDKITAAGVDRNRIFFTGYVSETEKLGLLYNASFCIYGSFFEGYGLPVLEAALLGKIVVCSNSSSMPEVAPQSCLFFDPNDIVQLSRAISVASQRSMRTRQSLQSFEDVRAELEGRNWNACYTKIADWIHHG